MLRKRPLSTDFCKFGLTWNAVLPRGRRRCIWHSCFRSRASPQHLDRLCVFPPHNCHSGHVAIGRALRDELLLRLQVLYHYKRPKTSILQENAWNRNHSQYRNPPNIRCEARFRTTPIALARWIVQMSWNLACRLLLAKLEDTPRRFLISAPKAQKRGTCEGPAGVKKFWKFFFFKKHFF